MSRKIHVLVFPCGSENGIEIHAALKDNVNIRLYGASGVENHGSFIYRDYFGGVPYINQNDFIEIFNSILIENNIDIVFPTHDDISLYLAENQSKLSSMIAVPGVEQAAICRSKLKTYKLFHGYSFIPRVYRKLDEIDKFPVFVKPDMGQGGKGSFICRSMEDFNIRSALNRDLTGYVITEYLPGEESTVDCFTDRYGLLRFVGPRKRNRIFGGISVNSTTQKLSKEIEVIAMTINSILKMRGLWYFQIKKDIASKYKLLEISVRTAGCMNLYRGLGVNFPLLTVYDIMNYDIDILCNDLYLEVDRALCNKYKSNLNYDTIYIDFDDTITRNGYPNPKVLSYLYNARNSNKTIILITKHNTDLIDTLNSLAIHPGLFDEVIQIGLEEAKYRKISKLKNSIFVDNSYKERADVAKYLNIPVFDVDAISTLYDWRE